MAKLVNFKFDFGDEVYIIVDPDQRKRMVTGMICRPGGIAYECTGPDIKWCYDFELSTEKDTVTSTTN